MVITIEGQKHELYFGFDFLKEINQQMGLEVEGIALQAGGIIKLQSALAMNDPVAIVTALRAGTSTNKERPTTAQLEKFLAVDLSDDEYEEVVEDLKDALKKSPIIRRALPREDETTNEKDETDIN